MFNSLKKKLQEGVKKLTKTVEEKESDMLEIPEPVEEKTEEPLQPEPEPTPGAQEAQTVQEPEQQEPDHVSEEKEKESIELEEESPPIEKQPEPAVEEEPISEPEKPVIQEEIQELEKPSEVIEHVDEPKLEKQEEKKEPPQEKRSFKDRLMKKIAERHLEEKDIDEFFDSVEMELLQANVALDVIDFLRKSLKEKLVHNPIKRRKAQEAVALAFEQSIQEAVSHGTIDLLTMEKGSCVIFLGFNGAGKTTSIAKTAHYLQQKGKSVVLAAGDTFRAAAIHQLDFHGEKLQTKVIKQQYGSDAAAVIFDAKKYAQNQKADIVLADTAGRTHVDKDLLDELKKIIRVNSPQLKILVIDSLTGNDAVEQARLFDEAVGVDAVILTKIDANKKGGAVLSVCYAIKKPVFFLGTGQEYDDIVLFDAQSFAKELLGL